MRSAAHVFIVLAAFLPGLALGQWLPSAHTPAIADESHAWIIVPSGTGHALLHLPPRRSTDRRPGSPDGTASVAARFQDRPQALAAWHRHVYVVMPPLWTKPRGLRRAVHRLSTAPIPGGSAWVYDAPDAFVTMPSLPGDGSIVSVVGSPSGPIVVHRDEQGVTRILTIRETDWADVTPWEDTPLLDVALIAEAGGLWALARTAESSFAWFAAWSPAPRPVSEPPAWSLVPDRFMPDLADDPFLASLGGTFIAARLGQGEDLVFAAETGRTLAPLLSLDAGRGQTGVSLLAESGRLLVVRFDPRGDDPAERLVELSAYTGRVFYDGPILGRGPVSADEIRILAVFLFAVSVITLVFVIRSPAGSPSGIGGRASEFPLGESLAMAEPSRRFAAGILDAVPGLLIGFWAWDLPLAWLMTPWRLLTTLDAAGALVTTLAIGWVLCTVTEWRSGRSPGKMLGGLWVVGLRRRGGVVAPDRPSFFQALARNTVRWWLPPAALVGMLVSTRRHAGDTLARTAVVIRL